MPFYSCLRLSFLNQHSADTLQNPKLHPALEGPVDGVVVLWIPGQSVPVASGAHPEYDADQNWLGINALESCSLGWAHVQNDRVNPALRSPGIFHIVGRTSRFPIIIHNSTRFSDLNRTRFAPSLLAGVCFEIVSEHTLAAKATAISTA